MIELFEKDVRMDNRKSSKGNQTKWLRDDVWYKADNTGYEGLSEYVISQLLKKTNLKENEFVEYHTEIIKYKHKEFSGCYSFNFLDEGSQLITLERLYQIHRGKSLYKDIFAIQNTENRMLFLIEQVEHLTGIRNFGVYLSILLTIDAVFLNEDRHMHNIAVIMKKDGSFCYSPIFDNGAGLLSDLKMDYPLGVDLYELISSVNSKTIDMSFDKQLDVAEKVFGYNLKFNFDKAYVRKILEEDNIYSDEIKARVYDCICEQMRKYQYLFVN